MLSTPATFPHPGSFALIEDSGAMRAVRIIDRAQPGLATISILARPQASGQRRVLLAELHDATPLSATEEDEASTLARVLRGRRSERDQAKVARLEALRRRAGLAPVLAAELAERDRVAAAAKRSAAYNARRADFFRQSAGAPA